VKKVDPDMKEDFWMGTDEKLLQSLLKETEANS
jgi:hypothetical protein